MQEIYQKIRESVNEYREEMLSLWKQIVNIDSASRNVEGVRKVGQILQKEMKDLGMNIQVLETNGAGPVLIGEYNPEKNDQFILFIGHMDTVFPDGTVKENPFRIDQNGFAHGPGVLDMKAGLVIALYAIKALQKAGYRKYGIKCIFAGDEENLHMFSKAKEVIIGQLAGAKAAFNFETGYMDDGFVIGRKGGGIIDLTVYGVAVHSGIAPETGRSAVLEMAHKIIEIESKNDIFRGKLINCGMIQGGIGENTVPGECKISMGIRFPTVTIRDEILSDIRRATERVYVEGTHAEMNIRMLMECMEATSEVVKLFEHVQKTAKECGYGEIHSFVVGGVSDSGITVSNGVPTICAMGVKGEANHTKDERAQVESLFTRTLLAAASVYTLT